MKEKIGEKIRQARVMQNLSQENISSELGISIGAYSNIERGKSEVTVTRLYLIAKILKISVTELLLSKSEIADEIPAVPEYPKLTDRDYLELNDLRNQLSTLQKDVATLKNMKAKKSKT